MRLRNIFAGLFVFGVAALGWVADGFGQKDETKEGEVKVEHFVLVDDDEDEEELDELHKKIMGQVKKALKKYEKELGDEKLDGILQKVEKALSGKLNHFEYKFDLADFDKEKLHGHLEKLGQLKKLDGKLAVPHVIQLQKQLGEKGAKRRVIGVMLESGDGKKAKVKEVMEKSAAKSAGIKVGDVIVKVNGKSVKDPISLSDTIQKTKGAVKVTVQRKGKNMELKVEPKEVATSALSQAIIDLEKVGDQAMIHFGSEDNIIEIHKDMIKKLGDGKGHGIFFVKPDGKLEEKEVEGLKKKIEWKIDRAAENKKLHERKANELKNSFKKKIEFSSDLDETVEKLKKQMKELQEEIKRLKKSGK